MEDQTKEMEKQANLSEKLANRKKIDFETKIKESREAVVRHESQSSLKADINISATEGTKVNSMSSLLKGGGKVGMTQAGA